MTPALEPVEQATAALPPAQSDTPARPAGPVSEIGPVSASGSVADRPEPARLDPESAFSARAMAAQRTSRGVARRAVARRAVNLRPAAAARLATKRSATTRSATTSRRAVARVRVQEVRHTTKVRVHHTSNSRPVRMKRAVRHARRTVHHARVVVARHAGVKRQRVRMGRMGAVIAYAKSQVGKRYVSGGEGGGGFDCSGLTKRAYEQAGIRLPHSSHQQAARARSVSRSSARPGDLVVGQGHVGIYMGNGMMIDAGNHRTGVVYRRLYSGLHVERF